MTMPKWEQLDYGIRRCLEKVGYRGFLPTDKNTLSQIIPQIMLSEGVRDTLEFLIQIEKFDELSEFVVRNPRPCAKLNEHSYDKALFTKIAQLHRNVGKPQVAGLLFMSVGQVGEAKRCFNEAPKMLKCAEPKSPWGILEARGTAQSKAEEIIQLLYSCPCPDLLHYTFRKRSQESEWKSKITSGLGLKWLSEQPDHKEVPYGKLQSARKLVAQFSEGDVLAIEKEFWLPRLLFENSLYYDCGVRADWVCFACGEYELAIQWALGYVQLDFGWFDSCGCPSYDRSKLLEDVALYFEFAGDYTCALAWCEEHNLVEPQRIARLRLLSGDFVGAATELQRAGLSIKAVEALTTGIKPKTRKHEDDTFHCPACGVEVGDGDNFCSDCGRQLGKKCSICGAHTSYAKEFCGKCGNRIC